MRRFWDCFITQSECAQPATSNNHINGDNMVFPIRGTVILIAVLFVARLSWADDTPPSAELVRNLLQGSESQSSGLPQLVKLGAKALPAYEVILADPKSKPLELLVVMGLVSEIKADRTRFRDLAVGLFPHSDPRVRREALQLLAEIGTEQDTSPILAMLSDEEKLIRQEAAKTLVKLGGKRDLVALDIWLKTGNYRNDIHYLNFVKECRDKLEKRLKETPKEQEPKK
jgi:HEAT repeat protein